MSADANKETLTDMAENEGASEMEHSVSSADPGTGDPALEAAESLSPEQVENLKAKAAQADEHWDKLLRVSADFDNFRKRAARERQEAIKFANESLLEKLLPVLDNFEMAIAASGSSANASQSDAVESLKTGVSMIYSQLKNVMTEAGLEEIDATHKAFDPNWHEAVAQQDSVDVPEGCVLQQLRKGYKLRDRLIRPAVVVVARKPAA
jgi:molecular chaperone GrpE